MDTNLHRFMVSATHRSSGKSTVSIGLCAAFSARGVAVQPFKKGPDYIDPMWLTAASGRPCRNLDPWLGDEDEILASFRRHTADAGLALVEGNTGLHDGLALDGSDSNAALARLLDLPVVLVIDARGMTRGVAPLVLGHQAFDRALRIAGVVLNNVSGTRHEAKLRMAMEHYTDVPVLGAVQRDDRLAILERHLGLMPSNEAGDVPRVVGQIREMIARQVDLDALVAAVASAAPLLGPRTPNTGVDPLAGDIRIGIAEDRAFGFYYPDDLDALRAAGATLPRFDTLHDSDLPRVDALFIGGGFPELYARELEANTALRARIRGAIDAGMPVYAECGGLMYLARSLTHEGRRYRMVGAIAADVVMRERPVGRGYVELEETEAFPWSMGTDGDVVRGHEFHYADLENIAAGSRFAYTVKRGHGIDGRHDGIVVDNLLASFTHLRSTRRNNWGKRFVEFVRGSEYYRRRRDNIVPLGVPRVREATLL